MLDTPTKKRIDDCRDILVGKLPDPKAQIEQITIGLIYKFMDDMDKESVELGGKAKFFTDYTIPDPENPHDRKKDIVVPFGKFAWDNLFNAKVTATEMLGLYSEAITGIDKNPNIPSLFRDIFKNAFLPYRDPETLKLFLKTIGEFEYTHSEKLGDAFEYLLSVMGSQGDAGQFRTPRHIIDFIVMVVDPGKNDTILDPACGTAGFLISAFKHIGLDGRRGNNAFKRIDNACVVSTMETTTSTATTTNTTQDLTPDERKKIIQNFVGYDISPDMVRLSLVNLYLHGFSDPHIWEYDSLSSEERWDETFDVILANPPFMSPKGGIRPHKKFSISSNRSEVLFVDYIAEHLNPKGRAGIIVPEGVIFQSGTAYKDLRKMLVDNYLYAVVSLPAGVFNPYSGVKTSILLMDKELAKKNDEILFVKIDNDGYGLGAQRNPVKGGQLEEAIKIIKDFVSVETGHDLSPVPNGIAHAVAKKEISKNGDYNLSGERHKKISDVNSDYPFVKLSDICDVRDGTHDSPKYLSDGYPLITSKNIKNGNIDFKDVNYISQADLDKINQRSLVDDGDIIMPMIGTIGNPIVVKKGREFAIKNVALIKFNQETQINNHYLRAILASEYFNENYKNFSSGSTQKFISLSFIRSLQIPLPPLSIQEEIVAEIEGYQKIIDGAKAVVENYKPKIDIDQDWEIVELGSHCKIKGGYAFKSTDYVEEGVQLIRMGNVKQMFFDVENSPSYLPKKYLQEYNDYILGKGDLLISMTGTTGKEDYGNVCRIDIDEKFLLNQRVGKFEIFSDKLCVDYIYYVANSDGFRKKLFANSSGGVRQSNISNKGIENIIIPLPPFETQMQIVTQIEQEQALVNANQQLIEIFEQKIKDRIAKVWGAEKKVYEMEEEKINLVAED